MMEEKNKNRVSTGVGMLTGAAGAAGLGYLGAKIGLKQGFKHGAKSALNTMEKLYAKEGKKINPFERLTGDTMGSVFGGMIGGTIGTAIGGSVGGVTGGVGGYQVGKRSTNKYLEKLAESKTSKNSEYAQALVAGGIAAPAVGGVAALAASVPLMKELTKHDTYGQKNETDFFNKAKKIRPSIHDLEHRTRHGRFSLLDGLASQGPHYSPKFHSDTHYITNAGSKNLGVLAHELGHAVDYSKPSMFGQKGGTHLKTYLRMGVDNHLTRLGVLGALGSNEKTRDYAVPAYAATYLPTLASEGAANHQGYKIIKELSGKKHANKFLKNIALKNTLSYWSMPVASTALLYAVKKGLDKEDKRTKTKP